LVTALGHSPVLIHLAAAALGAGLAAAVAASAWALAGPRAAVTGGLLTALAGAAPLLQGFMFNGELAAGAFSAAAVACALWHRKAGRAGLLVAAGALGAIAILMKQSGFDGLGTALVIAWLAARSWRRVRAAGWVCAGAALPLGAALLDAALTSWHDWWFAVLGYRLDTSAGTRGGLAGRWHNISNDLPHLWPDLLPLGALVLIGLVYVALRHSPLPLVWLVLAGAGFFGGVFFFPHYWMQLVGPACLLGALGLSLLPPRIAIALAVAACLPVLGWTARVTADSQNRRDQVAVPDPRLLANRQIAPWLRAHAQPGDQLYAFVSSADLYYSTGLHTDFRYLWQANLEAIPAAMGELRGYLAGTGRPDWVVIYQKPDLIDPSGTLGRELAAGYRQVAAVDGYAILHVER